MAGRVLSQSLLCLMGLYTNALVTRFHLNSLDSTPISTPSSVTNPNLLDSAAISTSSALISDSESETVTGMEKIDCDHPYYLYASDSPGMVLVSPPFDGSGYGGWRKSVLIAFSAKNKLGFINETLPRPKDGAPDLKSWIRCNDMVFAWLLNPLTVEIRSSVIHSKSVRILWKQLEDREICTCVDCKCGSFEKNHAIEERQKLVQFLLGLNETYTEIRGNIMMMQPSPTIDRACYLLLQEERQRSIQSIAQYPSESSSFAIYPGNILVKAGRSLNAGNGPNSYKNNQEYIKNLFCNYCKKPEHTIERCFKLHGYPQNTKNPGNRKTKYYSSD
ncbi:PREDICTED: uncharacterized protein LOC109215546 [Nicotiana attenuata]|uniref:uncharacterized protein LOC109215546 n=1 Tax=Nicotiana attenuata TaxID=49451 RepID=UPI000905B149|nr:PREDICTED: uncharacterized protein LOC109215546 [Nicotiana attenuata]